MQDGVWVTSITAMTRRRVWRSLHSLTPGRGDRAAHVL